MYVDVDDVMLKDGISPKPRLSLSGIVLTEADKSLIVAGGGSTDMHINFAQAILKKQFTNLAGLKSTFLLPTLQKSDFHRSEALQIIHCRGNHWVVVSTVRCSSNVMVFVSLS